MLPAQREEWASPCNTATRVNLAHLAALGNGGEKGDRKSQESRGKGGERNRWRESRESNLEGWSGDREQCGRAWSLNSRGLGSFSLLG